MGMIDEFAPNPTVMVRNEEYTALVERSTKLSTVEIALKNGEPVEMIAMLLTGEKPELAKYRALGTTEDIIRKLHELNEYKRLGVTPEQIREMDKLYLEKCQEVTRLDEKVKVLAKKAADSEREKENWKRMYQAAISED